MIRHSIVLASLLALFVAACGKVETGQPDAPVTPTATLVVTVSGGGGTVSSAPAGINCGSDCSETYDVGTAVTLTATPDASATFLGWSGGGCSGTGICAVTINADTAVTAMFAANNSLTVVPEGNGTGTVTSSPGGINCGSDCTEVYTAGTVVTLTAVADLSSRFTGWSGGGCSGTGSCVVTLSAATTVSATFELNRYTLTVTPAGNGSGTVSSTPAGIDCGADCAEDHDHGTVVTLTAAAASNSTFAGWTGGGCTGTGTCVVTLTAATTVTATFMLNTAGVTVMRAGNGTGTVTSNPAGINCGADCSETYSFGTIVTLTAAAATGSTFTGWSGGGCVGTGPCIITVAGATAVTATFTLTQHTLTVTRAGTGTGTVTSSPAGINCGADCTETVNYGTTLTLAAAPASGSSFTGWSGGGCSGTGACVVSVTAATTVTATFALNTYTLSVTRAGSGSGTVTSSPAGINCGADCAEVYNHGTAVTLTATPAAGQAFSGWTGGGCSGTGTCVVTMTASISVTATFTSCPTGSTTFNYTGGLQTFTVPACVTSIVIDAYGAQGGNAVGENGTQPFSGGLGARIRGTFAVSGGQQLTVLVGGAGASATPPPSASCGAAGGGGSFVVSAAGVPLVIAGGGGGGFHCNYYNGANGGAGQITSNGGAGIPATGGMGMPPAGHPGGTMGGGGRAYFGSGGGGFSGAGVAEYTGNGNTGGGAYPGGGGTPGGGYGGGGSYYGYCCGGGGGGGGYSGGSGGTSDGCAGGGGGSINNGTSQLNSAGVRSGNGTVIISY